MKRFMLSLILTLSLTILSCGGKSPQKVILGEWAVQGENMTLTFNSDGTVNAPNGEQGRWELKEGLVLRVFNADGEFDRVIIVTFIDDDEMRVQDGENEFILKRNR